MIHEFGALCLIFLQSALDIDFRQGIVSLYEEDPSVGIQIRGNSALSVGVLIHRLTCIFMNFYYRVLFTKLRAHYNERVLKDALIDNIKKVLNPQRHTRHTPYP